MFRMATDRRKDEEALYNLRGKTLRAYIHILTRSEPIGVRELQRELGFSSPSVAAHHIERLADMGLIEKDGYGRYYAAKKVDVAVLQPFTKIGRFMLPRHSFYAAFFTTLTSLYIIQHLNQADLHTLLLGLSATAAFWYEALRTWRKKPF